VAVSQNSPLPENQYVASTRSFFIATPEIHIAGQRSVGVVTVTGPVVRTRRKRGFYSKYPNYLEEDAVYAVEAAGQSRLLGPCQNWITEPTLPLGATNVTNGPRPRSKLNTVPQPMESKESAN